MDTTDVALELPGDSICIVHLGLDSIIAHHIPSSIRGLSRSYVDGRGICLEPRDSASICSLRERENAWQGHYPLLGRGFLLGALNAGGIFGRALYKAPLVGALRPRDPAGGGVEAVGARKCSSKRGFKLFNWPDRTRAFVGARGFVLGRGYCLPRWAPRLVRAAAPPAAGWPLLPAHRLAHQTRATKNPAVGLAKTPARLLSGE